jgi:hypothetical protein
MDLLNLLEGVAAVLAIYISVGKLQRGLLKNWLTAWRIMASVGVVAVCGWMLVFQVTGNIDEIIHYPRAGLFRSLSVAALVIWAAVVTVWGTWKPYHVKTMNIQERRWHFGIMFLVCVLIVVAAKIPRCSGSALYDSAWGVWWCQQG